MEDLEKEVLHSPGLVSQLSSRLDRIESSRLSTVIEMGGVVFQDELALDSWLRSFNDPDVNRFVPDFVSLFFLAEPKFETVDKGLQQAAAAAKAQFSSLDVATINLSYSITYPPHILHSTDKQSALEIDTVEWATAFSSHRNFEGTYNNGTHLRLRKAIGNVRKALEGGVDVTFPVRSQPQSNAVFKAQINLAAAQCLEFLDSCTPLFKKISGGGMEEKDAWSRVLVFTKNIFDDVAKERAINSEGTTSSKVWASFKTTEMLKGYQAHNWVEHPKTSSILALTSMQKEGKSIAELTSSVKSHSASVQKLETELKRIKEELKELKKKNPSLA